MSIQLAVREWYQQLLRHIYVNSSIAHFFQPVPGLGLSIPHWSFVFLPWWFRALHSGFAIPHH
ncbi:MAG: hypothetical protein ACXWCT_02960, partial [Flavitalea sp.]